MKWKLLLSGVVLGAVGCLTHSNDHSTNPTTVEVRQQAGRWQLYLKQLPDLIKGAGGSESLTKLKEARGNSIRNWGTDGLQSILDDAHKHGLTVCVGIWLHHQHAADGFDYDKPGMVQEQLGQVRQPGLTGQVKEYILCRWGELGVVVEAGQIRFRPDLQQRSDFSAARTDFRCFDLAGAERRLRLPLLLAFTYCQTLIVHRLASISSVVAVQASGH